MSSANARSRVSFMQQGKKVWSFDVQTGEQNLYFAFLLLFLNLDQVLELPDLNQTWL